MHGYDSTHGRQPRIYWNLLRVQVGPRQTSRSRTLELDRITKRESEAWSIYDSGEEGWDREGLKRRLAELSDKRKALERRLKEVAAAERVAERTKSAAAEVKRAAQQYSKQLRDLPGEKRSEVFQLLVKRVTLHRDDSLTIEWRFPALGNEEGNGMDSTAFATRHAAV